MQARRVERMAAAGIEIGDLLADSGYAYRVPETWALPMRRLGVSLNLYCPATPSALLELGPLHRGATEEEAAAHDQKARELARHKLSPITGYDEDGYRRLACPIGAANAPP